MLATLRKAEYAELMILFFIQAAAMSAWFVPLGTILDAHGLHTLKPYAYGASAVAAFISPLIFGAMADRHAPPALVLRGLSLATAVLLAVISTAINFGWNQWLLLGIIQVFYLFYSPTFSISTALVFARLRDAKKEFGPIRAMATIGWMAGAIFVSLLGFDRSPMAGYVGVGLWLVVAGFTFWLPKLEVPAAAERLSWHERLGLDALTLLKKREIRVVFLTTTLFNIPLAGFYPYAPAHLHDLGFEHTSAWVALGQITEIIAMFSLAWLLLKHRMKWIFLAGLSFGVARFAISAFNTKYALLLGITLHGASFVLVIITAQIFLEQNINPAWRARAQALMTLMNGGIGNLIGYLGIGWWFNACSHSETTRWSAFWGGLAVLVGIVMIYFLISFRDAQKTKAPIS